VHVSSVCVVGDYEIHVISNDANNLYTLAVVINLPAYVHGRFFNTLPFRRSTSILLSLWPRVGLVFSQTPGPTCSITVVYRFTTLDDDIPRRE